MLQWGSHLGVGKEENKKDLGNFWGLLKRVLKECYRIMVIDSKRK